MTVLFIPRTQNGELARRMRQAETDLEKLTGFKVKIVEKAGTMIKRIVTNSNPWAGGPCGRPECLVCKHENGGGNCRKRNITYRTRCETCQEKNETGGGEKIEKVYIGESSRTGFERGIEHQRDFETAAEDSHMSKHWAIDHENEEKPIFSMKIIQRHKSAFVRQISEAVLIELNSKNSLNSKSEYNRCQIPRLNVKMGEIDVKEKKQKLMTESEIDLAVMDNEKRKRQVCQEIDQQPKTKRRKVRMKRPEKHQAGKRERKETSKLNLEVENERKRMRMDLKEVEPGICDNNDQQIHDNLNAQRLKNYYLHLNLKPTPSRKENEAKSLKTNKNYLIFNSGSKPKKQCVQAEKKAHPTESPPLAEQSQPPPPSATQPAEPENKAHSAVSPPPPPLCQGIKIKRNKSRPGQNMPSNYPKILNHFKPTAIKPTFSLPPPATDYGDEVTRTVKSEVIKGASTK